MDNASFHGLPQQKETRKEGASYTHAYASILIVPRENGFVKGVWRNSFRHAPKALHIPSSPNYKPFTARAASPHQMRARVQNLGFG